MAPIVPNTSGPVATHVGLSAPHPVSKPVVIAPSAPPDPPPLGHHLDTLNGVVGDKISRVWGLRQANLLLPLLVVVAMDVLTYLTIREERENLPSSLIIESFAGAKVIDYADDVVLFVKPSVQDLEFVRKAFTIFREASGCT